MISGPITIAIRNAIINNHNRQDQIGDIMSSVDCSRVKAKELYFAFIYRATEEYLVYLLQKGEDDE